VCVVEDYFMKANHLRHVHAWNAEDQAKASTVTYMSGLCTAPQLLCCLKSGLQVRHALPLLRVALVLAVAEYHQHSSVCVPST
jgi:hypothetical protein